MYNDVRLITLRENADKRGSLIAIEGNNDIPFEIKRIFYIYNTNNDEARGKHANRITEFVMICVRGSCNVCVRSGKTEYTEYVLDHPSKALYIGKMIWKEMRNFSPDAVLLCIASEIYNPNEYIYDFEEYLKEVTMYSE